MTHLKSQQGHHPRPPPTEHRHCTVSTIAYNQLSVCSSTIRKTFHPTERTELTEACNRVGNNKAPGLDGIPNIVFKTAIKAAPRLFLGVYDICLKEGTFPLKWKQQ
ncbi:hypothetical protein EVAR_96497_1 [Eumeta japonica]|uniref:Uncharacterized protein n=1 Tax=Eumeta variegata TaxID=151549 RepID=A0A4C1ZXF1_EUMVA|nr:hypothetical protein EVAR_96497_1 [Eumeta japonica]